MQRAGVISDYVEALAGRLAFDRRLARNVRHEVEDHLREAAAAMPIEDAVEAECRAVAMFGDPRTIAAQLAVASLDRYARRAAAVTILVIAAAFVAMKGRVAWYAAMEVALRDDLKTAAALVGIVDRYAFWTSVAIGIAGWIAAVPQACVPPLASGMSGSLCCARWRRRHFSCR